MQRGNCEGTKGHRVKQQPYVSEWYSNMHSFINKSDFLLRYFVTLLRQRDNDDIIIMFLNLYHHIANTSMLKN